MIDDNFISVWPISTQKGSQGNDKCKLRPKWGFKVKTKAKQILHVPDQ